MSEDIEKKIREFIEVTSYKRIEGGKNEVFLLHDRDGQKYTLKIYNSKFVSQEAIMYRRLRGSSSIKRILCFDKDFILTEYIEGDNISDLLINDTCKFDIYKNVIKDIVGFISECNEIKGEGVGIFSDDFLAEPRQWFEFLLDHLDGLSNDIKDDLYLFELYLYLRRYLVHNKEKFYGIESRVIPIDLNMNNFLMKANGETVCIDLDAAWLGDKLLSFGELMSHIYGTRLYFEFLRYNYDFYINNYKKIHFYAIYSTFSILTYLKCSGQNYQHINPWGNKCNFTKLINAHKNLVEQPENFISEINLINHFGLHSMGEKTLLLNEHSESKIQFERLEKCKEIAGITRISDITGLDEIGICAIQATRINVEKSDESFSVFSGKGMTKEQCIISATMEAIERFCAESKNNANKVEFGTINEMINKKNIIRPTEISSKGKKLLPDAEIAWVKGYDLISKKYCYIPAANVFFPYKSSSQEYFERGYTTGLAAGNSYLEAIVHGICETIERDAAAMNLIFREAKNVVLESIEDTTIQNVIKKIMCVSGLKIYIKFITTQEIPLPIFQVILDDTERRDPMFVCGGYGAHPNKNIALLNALNEAVMSRLGTISGAREDLKKFYEYKKLYTYDEFKKKYLYWFEEKDGIEYQNIISYDLPTVWDDFMLIINLLKRAGFSKIICVDLANKEMGIPVVKMVVPGLERYSFKMDSFGRHAISHMKIKEGGN